MCHTDLYVAGLHGGVRGHAGVVSRAWSCHVSTSCGLEPADVLTGSGPVGLPRTAASKRLQEPLTEPFVHEAVDDWVHAGRDVGQQFEDSDLGTTKVLRGAL